MIHLEKLAENKMCTTLEAFKIELAQVRTGRAHPGLLEDIMVDCNGIFTRLGHIAAITVLDARALNIQPYDRTTSGVLEKAIRGSELGLNPSNRGDVIQVRLPLLTEERRHEFVKLIKAKGENARVLIRAIRCETNNAAKRMVKQNEISDRIAQSIQKATQKLTDDYILQINDLVKNKEVEVMKI